MTLACPACAGISVQLALESLSSFGWNRCPACAGIRTRFLEIALPPKGFSYRMVIGEDLAREPQLTTALTLLKYGRRPISLLEREQVRRLIAITGSIKWGTASNGVLGSRHRFILARLFLNGALSIDLDTPLGPDTLFTETANSDEQQ